MTLANAIIRLTVLVSLLVIGTHSALAATDDGLVAIPPLKALVTDLTGTLSQQQINELDATLKNFEKASGSQIAVLIVPTTKPEEIEQYSIRVVDQWKLGRKKVDDGILLIIAKDDRKLRIEVGYGLEGAIPDVIAKRIIEEIIVPYFKKDDYYGGISAGVDSMIKIISGEPLPPPKETKKTKGFDSTDTWIAVFFVVIFVIAFLQKIFGRLLGSAIVAAIIGFAVWALLGIFIAAAIAGIVAFIFALFIGGSGGGFWGGGGWGSGGGWSGGGDSWGGGGGGGFGGGGSSGSW